MPVTVGSEGGSSIHRCCLDITQCRFSPVKLSLDEAEDGDNHVVIKSSSSLILLQLVAVVVF
jgi:hypothetical protein